MPPLSGLLGSDPRRICLRDEAHGPMKLVRNIEGQAIEFAVPTRPPWTAVNIASVVSRVNVAGFVTYLFVCDTCGHVELVDTSKV